MDRVRYRVRRLRCENYSTSYVMRLLLSRHFSQYIVSEPSRPKLQIGGHQPMAMSLNTPVREVVLSDADKSKLTPAAAKITLGDLLLLSAKTENPRTLHLTMKDIHSLEAAFADQVRKLDPGAQDVNCCCCAPCCCCSAAAMPAPVRTA